MELLRWSKRKSDCWRALNSDFKGFWTRSRTASKHFTPKVFFRNFRVWKYLLLKKHLDTHWVLPKSRFHHRISTRHLSLLSLPDISTWYHESQSPVDICKKKVSCKFDKKLSSTMSSGFANAPPPAVNSKISPLWTNIMQGHRSGQGDSLEML